MRKGAGVLEWGAQGGPLWELGGGRGGGGGGGVGQEDA